VDARPRFRHYVVEEHRPSSEAAEGHRAR
jgi:hypothetical protein